MTWQESSDISLWFRGVFWPLGLPLGKTGRRLSEGRRLDVFVFLAREMVFLVAQAWGWELLAPPTAGLLSKELYISFGSVGRDGNP
jgi:hypothetical protein